MQAVKTLPATNRKRGYLGPRHRVSPSPRETRQESMGIMRVTSSSPVGRSLLKSASGASEFIGVLDRMSTKLQNKLRSCISVKTKLLKGLRSVMGVDDSTLSPGIPTSRKGIGKNHVGCQNTPYINSGRGWTSSKHRPRCAIQSAQELSGNEGPVRSLCECTMAYITNGGGENRSTKRVMNISDMASYTIFRAMLFSTSLNIMWAHGSFVPVFYVSSQLGVEGRRSLCERMAGLVMDWDFIEMRLHAVLFFCKCTE
eukprot:303600-Pelagomonas_calceolata.AAC.3